jgi:FkbM family methyltransferase
MTNGTELPFKMIIETEIEKWRSDTFWSKEPETIQWINNFDYNAILYDIGANIGIYSLYCASLYPHSLIFAFEPVRCNYARLLQNIELNGFDNIIALPIGVSGISRIDTIREISEEIGHSGSLINNIPDDDITKVYMIPTVTIDEVANLWKIEPNHIKIDIDCGEHDIVVKGIETLRNEKVKSCLVEINNHRKEICRIMKACGYTENNKFNKADNHSRNRRKTEPGNTAENVIFTRA